MRPVSAIVSSALERTVTPRLVPDARAFERLIAELSAIFTDVTPERFDEHVHIALPHADSGHRCSAPAGNPHGNRNAIPRRRRRWGAGCGRRGARTASTASSS